MSVLGWSSWFAGPRRYRARRLSPSLAAARVLSVALFIGLALPTSAGAVIHLASVVDGPANDIVDVDGAAMAPDGTGGILYRKQVDGVTHVFVVQFVDGHWSEPIEVDSEDSYGASEPAIAAGENGRLLVVWVQPRNVDTKGITLYELMSASLQPGASSFGQPIIVDPNVGEPYTGDVSAVDPRLAMAPSGAAYVVYRVIANDCDQSAGDPFNSSCQPDSEDKVVDVRVARFEYLTWSSLGEVNRAPQLAMPNPTNENAPAIGIDLDGDGVVVWQEPESGGVARIWVRRLFGTVKGNVLQASPEAIGGRPVTTEADAPTIAVGPYGEARIVFRIHGGQGSAVTTTQLYVNSIASETALHGSQLEGAAALSGTAQDDVGPPSDAIDVRGDFRVAWDQGGAAMQLTGGTEKGIGPPAAIGQTGGAVATAINPAGGGVAAWSAPVSAPPAVDVREDYTQGAFQTAQLAGEIAGPVSEPVLGGNGQGDALIGFMQGPPGQSEVVGDFVQAPPAPFVLDLPSSWVRARSALISWEAAPDMIPGVTYTVYVDGKPRLKDLTGLSAHLGPVGMGDGVHQVQVLATDASGQQTMSAVGELKIDADPPIVRVRLIAHGHGVRVSVRSSASGVDTQATRIAFGDGGQTNRRAVVTHVYRRPGRYTITAYVRDNVGNAALVHLRVRVR